MTVNTLLRHTLADALCSTLCSMAHLCCCQLLSATLRRESHHCCQSSIVVLIFKVAEDMTYHVFLRMIYILNSHSCCNHQYAICPCRYCQSITVLAGHSSPCIVITHHLQQSHPRISYTAAQLEAKVVSASESRTHCLVSAALTTSLEPHASRRSRCHSETTGTATF